MVGLTFLETTDMASNQQLKEAAIRRYKDEKFGPSPTTDERGGHVPPSPVRTNTNERPGPGVYMKPPLRAKRV